MGFIVSAKVDPEMTNSAAAPKIVGMPIRQRFRCNARSWPIRNVRHCESRSAVMVRSMGCDPLEILLRLGEGCLEAKEII